jgi:hypothetical protein
LWEQQLIVVLGFVARPVLTGQAHFRHGNGTRHISTPNYRSLFDRYARRLRLSCQDALQQYHQRRRKEGQEEVGVFSYL